MSHDISQAAYFFDFDHTLFDLDRFFHQDVYQQFLDLGLNKQQWKATYTETRNGGYTLERHIDAIQSNFDVRLPRQAMLGVIDNRFSDLSEYVYGDVVSNLERIKQSSAKMFLLSFGNPDWQRYKVTAAGLINMFDQVFFTETEGTKTDVIAAERVGYDQVVMIDNNPAELDRIKLASPDVETYYMQRPVTVAPAANESLKYNLHQPKFKHHPCTSLDDILVS